MSKLNAADLLRPAAILGVVTAATALLLALVNLITVGPITAGQEAKTAAALAQVLPAEEYIPTDYTGDDPLVTALYQAGSAGWVVEVSTPGYGGDLIVLVGVDWEGVVTGAAITKHSETSGLGDRTAKPDFLEQFTGAAALVAVTQDGGTIDAVTGATISSRAVARGVNAARAAAALAQEGGLT